MTLDNARRSAVNAWYATDGQPEPVSPPVTPNDPLPTPPQPPPDVPIIPAPTPVSDPLIARAAFATNSR